MGDSYIFVIPPETDNMSFTSGFIVTYIAPLAFVLCVTMGKEAYDDYQRHLRDREANGTCYLTFDRASLATTNQTLTRVVSPGASMPEPPLTRSIPSSKIKVGDLILLEKNMRIPADMILLRTSEGPKPHSPKPGDEANENRTSADPNAERKDSQDDTGTCFVRTDQLDGETDWKLRIALTKTQKMGDRELMMMQGEMYGASIIG